MTDVKDCSQGEVIRSPCKYPLMLAYMNGQTQKDALQMGSLELSFQRSLSSSYNEPSMDATRPIPHGFQVLFLLSQSQGLGFLLMMLISLPTINIVLFCPFTLIFAIRFHCKLS